MKRIFITGGSGTLGGKLVEYCRKQGYEVLAPTRKEFDLENIWDRLNYEKLTVFEPDIIIHTAALVNTLVCEIHSMKALENNVIGTTRLVQLMDSTLIKNKPKFIYISSEYVFGGDKGNYKPEDRLDPINVYGKTKAAAEYIVSILPHYQIIRVPFIKKQYNKAFSNQIVSRYFIDEIPDKIIDNILYNPNQIVHISTDEPKSLYDHYVDKNIKVDPIPIPDEYKDIIPRNTSLRNTSPF